MIAEAVDAALELWQALWMWIIAGAAVATLGGLGMLAVVWAVCRMLRRAWGVMRPGTDSLPPLTAEQASEVPTEPGTPDKRVGPRWARDDHEPRRAA